MRFVALLALLASVSIFAGEEQTSRYTETIGTAVYGYEQTECVAEGGMFEEAMCFFEVDNELFISKKEGKVSKVEVLTWGANAHSCTFESSNISGTEDKLIAREATEVYDYQTGDFKPATCVVTIEKNENGGYSVDNNNNCQEFCGMRAGLWIDNAQ